MDTSELRRQYKSKAEVFRRLKGVVRFVITRELKKKKIPFHSVLARIKSFNSLLEKVQRRKITDPFSEIRDIVGLRVVCLYLDDLEKIADIIRTSFAVIEEENIDTDTDSFKYQLPQFKVKLKDKSTDPEYNLIKGIPFEIQVRTVAQDAWASISHHLDYKQTIGIPNHVRRDFSALHGLFYVADTHFVMIKKEAEGEDKAKNLNDLQ